MASGGGAPRVRLGRVLILSVLLSTAALGGLFGPRLWAAATAPNGALTRAKKKFDMWRGIAQFKDKRIKAVVNAGAPPKAKNPR